MVFKGEIGICKTSSTQWSPGAADLWRSLHFL